MNTKSKGIILLIDSIAGTGHNLRSIDRLKEIVTAAPYAEIVLTVSVVDDHRKVSKANLNFLDQSRMPANYACQYRELWAAAIWGRLNNFS